MARTLPILTFHALDDKASAISFLPQVFRRGLAKLHESGYRTLSLLEAAEYLRQRAPFPDRSLVITFDDGYQSVYEEAFPILQRYGFSAAVFLTVGEKGGVELADRLPSLQGRSMLSWREIGEMHRAGITFGAHTLTHPDLTRLPLERAQAEICDSKAVIENMLGAPVVCFAYPYGRYNPQTREIVQQHFACACSDKLGLVTTSSDPYTLERIEMYYFQTDRMFDLIMTRIFPWHIRARSIPRRIRRILQGWRSFALE